ncbi:hypothetical protein SASPL_126067 [Salvia splendens]|uniref:DC1 domain-containing protein n=1 Tax=Salvia splendens TaxID=180675 RepID=A0A8X8XK35_SALSN|nr:hypothetical protein SASPL_126067 [Salvia splendens]
MKYIEISDTSHAHNLKFEYAEAPFKCDGCKEAGIGSRYKCGGACEFELHTHCGIPSPTITHPFYHKCSFQFMRRPPGPVARYCNACEKDVVGFVYHCRLCGFDLHPCCAKLPMMIDDGEIKLYMYKKVVNIEGREKGEELEVQIMACVKETAGMRPKAADHKKSRKGINVEKCCEVAGLALHFSLSYLPL